MPVTANFDISKITKALEKKFNVDIKEDVREAVVAGALDIVNAAKANDTYKDRTGQLRSSIGFVVYKDGQKTTAYFQQSGTGDGTGGATGTQKGEAVADEIAQQNNGKGEITVAIVAGADYALAVESKGYDVMTSHTNHAQDFIMPHLNDLEEALQELKDSGDI